MTTVRLTDAELARQDAVDNGCRNLIERLAGRPVDWNIEAIGRVRDAVEEVVVDRLGLMTRREFYPFTREFKGNGDR